MYSSERENQIIEAAPILGPVVSVAPFAPNASTTSGLPVSFSYNSAPIVTLTFQIALETQPAIYTLYLPVINQ